MIVDPSIVVPIKEVDMVNDENVPFGVYSAEDFSLLEVFGTL